MTKKISFGLAAVFVLFALTACTVDANANQRTEQLNQAKNQSQLVKTQPAPNVNYSVGRQNLIDRMNRMNDKNLVGYIYLLADTGTVVTSYVTKGRPTSMQQYLTSYDMLVYGNGEVCTAGSSGDCYNVESPDYDGTYGYAPEGIFFFTDTGAMVEWTGKYVWTDQPLTVRTQPTLVRKVK
jgi:hypothetical protein